MSDAAAFLSDLQGLAHRLGVGAQYQEALRGSAPTRPPAVLPPVPAPFVPAAPVMNSSPREVCAPPPAPTTVYFDRVAVSRDWGVPLYVLLEMDQAPSDLFVDAVEFVAWFNRRASMSERTARRLGALADKLGVEVDWQQLTARIKPGPRTENGAPAPFLSYDQAVVEMLRSEPNTTPQDLALAEALVRKLPLSWLTRLAFAGRHLYLTARELEPEWERYTKGLAADDPLRARLRDAKVAGSCGGSAVLVHTSGGQPPISEKVVAHELGHALSDVQQNQAHSPRFVAAWRASLAALRRDREWYLTQGDLACGEAYADSFAWSVCDPVRLSRYPALAAFWAEEYAAAAQV
jgi:hypothetical protein